MIKTNLLSQKLSQVIKAWNVPGCAIGIQKDKRKIFDFFHGVKDIENKDLIEEDTPFCIASIGKFFVSIAILHLHEQEKLSIYNSVESYLPYFKMKDQRYKDITIEMLLSHTSGLPDLTLDEYLKVLNDDKLTYKDYVLSFSEKPLESPGTQFIYSNYGYSVLAEIISVVSKKAFTDYMREDIFDKVGMKHSHFDYPLDLTKVAFPHLRVPRIQKSKKYPYSLVEAPSSFMHTTVGDILSFYDNLDKLISKEMFEQMVYPKSERNYPPFYKASGLGVNIGEFNHYKVYSHGGMGFGFTGFYMIFPELDISAIVMCNEESYALEQLYHLVAQAITNLPFSIGKPSWIIPLSKIYEEEGPDQALIEARRLLESEEYSTDKEDLINIIYQIVVAKEKERFIEFTQFFLQLFPDNEEVKTLINSIKL